MINRISINGSVFQGSAVDIVGGRVIVNGKDVTDQTTINPVMEVRILEGTIENLRTDASVTCTAVNGSVDARGSVRVTGSVGGSVDAGGSVECGDVSGNVRAGGSAQCGSVSGSVKAGGSVVHR